MPVVVSLSHHPSELSVFLLGKEFASETRHRRKAERTEHPIDVHVVNAGLEVVAALAQLSERSRLHAVLVRGPTGDGVETDVWNLLTFEDPHIRAVALVHEPGRTVLPLGRQMSFPHVRRLTNVIVHADQDHVVHLHGKPSGPP